MIPSDLATLDATAQAALVEAGQCSPSDLVEAAIERIERVDPEINAVVTRLFDRAREEAASKALPRGPFRGVPLLLKDLGCHVRGVPVYDGTRFLRDRDWRAPDDSYLAARFRAAGFIIVGKTNTPELGLSPTTEPNSFGPTRNPWNRDRIVGGSSGGSAAAVAAGLTPIAHAGDGGGSIRNPAGACGLVGLKPSRGRTSMGPGKGEGWAGCVTEHVVTRSIRDAAAVLDCVAGPAPGDPYFAPPPARPFVAELGEAPGSLRIGRFTDNDFIRAQPESLRAVELTADLLRELGHSVDDAYPSALDESELDETTSIAVAVSVARDLAEMEALVGESIEPGDIEPATLAIAEHGRSVSAPAYVANLDRLHAYGRRLRSWWAESPGTDGYDILITPTMAEPAPSIGSIKDAEVERIIRLVPYTMPYNVSGQPAIALPLHWTEDGLPVGIQLVARYGAEDLLICLAAQIEATVPWRDRRPPIHA